MGRTNREEIQEIQKYNQLGRRIGAKALVFATFAESWSQETQTNIGNILSDPDVKVILLTKSDLLAD